MEDFFGKMAAKFIVKPTLWLLSPWMFIFMGIPAWIIGGQEAMEETMNGWVNAV